MQKRHFEALAASLRAVKPKTGSYGAEAAYVCAYDAWRACVEEISAVCSQQNPRFDRSRFMAACGVTP